MRIKLVYLFMFGILCILNAPAWASIIAPYGVDANTLHLWHLDEAGVPAADQAHYNYVGTYTNKPDANLPLASLNGGTVGTTRTSFTALGVPSYTGFGTALDTSNVSQNPPYPTNSNEPALNALPHVNGTADNVDMTFDNPTTHAFTMEAIIRISFNPNVAWSQPQEIMSGEGDASDSSDRSFQFRIQPITAGVAPVLRFQKVSGFGGIGGSTANWNADANIPTTGPDAIMMDHWYHVAVTYNGVLTDTNGLKLYWTALDPSRTAANALAITGSSTPATPAQMNGWLREIDCDFALGNEMRDFNGETEPFIGLIDEVRISDLPRGADQMIFVPEPATGVMALIGIFGLGLLWLRKGR